MEEQLPRKLAAILYADVAEYSRLTGEDEDATHRTLRLYLDVISQTIASHRGQVMHYAGDALLAKFDAVVDAVAGAVAIQDELKKRNENLPVNRKLQFRIGVNLGDVIEDRGDIYGDGVNIAARLESLGEPGGICISGSVHDAIGTKLAVEYEFIGEREVKNIATPVRVYRVRPAGHELGLSPGESVLIAGATSPESAQVYTPSIAVLPFNAIGGDPEEQRLADGITDNIINTLARTEHFVVPNRTSLFAYQGKSPRPDEVADNLGVEHVLEGGVQRFGDQVRVTVQLADTATGHQIWSDRVDWTGKDVFELQDYLAQHVAMALRVVLLFGEAGRNWTDLGISLEASVLQMRSTVYLVKSTRADVARAREIGEELMRLEPNFVCGPVNAAWAHWIECYLGWSVAPDASLESAMKLARRAVELDPDYAESWVLLAQIHLTRGQYDQAIEFGEKALTLSPNDPFNMAMLAWVLNYAGDTERACVLVTKAIRLFPRAPDFVYRTLGLSHHLIGQYAEALAAYERATSLCGGDPTLYLAYQAVVLIDLERSEEARAKIARALALTPDLSIAKLRYMTWFRDPDHREHFCRALRESGLPE